MMAPRRYDRARDLDSWTRDTRIAERGFVHPWHSEVAPGNGEDFFVDQLDRDVGADDVVLDLGCGHGELTLDLAQRCRLAIGIDRDDQVLGLASELAAERGTTNVQFVRSDVDHGQPPGMSVPPGAVTVVVNRRGPTADKWLGWIRTLAAPGGIGLVMHPAGGPPRPGWAGKLPDDLCDAFGEVPHDEVRSWVERPLAAESISDFRLWWFDVPEWFATADDLHARLAGRAAGISEPSHAILRQIIADGRDPKGVPLRHQRLVARFRLPA